MTRRLNGLAVFLGLYALVALWFNVTVFAIMMGASMGCLIQGERLRRKHIQAAKKQHPSTAELARCMDCGGWWTLDNLALNGGACGHCAPVRAPGIGGER